MKNILQLSTDFLYQGLYAELVKSLDERGLEQAICLQPRKNKNEITLPTLDNGSYFRLKFFSKWMRFFYKKRIDYIKNQISASIDLENIDLIYCHFLFTDGGIGYLIKKELDIPYVVTIRNTDINLYYKYFVMYRKFGKKILDSAEKIVFLSPAMKKTFVTECRSSWDSSFEAKTHIIPNGISSAWYRDCAASDKPINAPAVKLVYFGEYSKNKNLEFLIKCIELLNKDKDYQFSLTLVGEYGDNSERIISLANETLNVRSLKKITNRNELIGLVDRHDIFVMASINETFGLAYIESIARGKPVIYTKNQGIDGYFKQGEIGYAVDTENLEELSNRVLDICNNYAEISKRCIQVSKDFQWPVIVKKIVKNILT